MERKSFRSQSIGRSHYAEIPSYVRHEKYIPEYLRGDALLASLARQVLLRPLNLAPCDGWANQNSRLCNAFLPKNSSRPAAMTHTTTRFLSICRFEREVMSGRTVGWTDVCFDTDADIFR